MNMENNEKEINKNQPEVRENILVSLEKSLNEYDELYKKLS
ncbi:MAG: hypothetical protein RLY38_394 [Actinomycetota bacterium]